MNLFKEIFVWRRDNETTAIRYTCLQDLKTGRYSVQSADHFRTTEPAQEQYRIFQKQFIELFVEESCMKNDEFFDDLETAIREFENDFDD